MINRLDSSFGFELPEEMWLGRVREAVLAPPPSGLAQCSTGFAIAGGSDYAGAAAIPRYPLSPISFDFRQASARSEPSRSPSVAASGDYIASYRILRRIGQGGMGVVFEAEQARPRRIVALKVMRPGVSGSAARRRFELEAQLLGRLQHPGIAQIFEAGIAETSEGHQPYFAMELIRGVSLGRHVIESGLSTRARLELMARVADAVHYAHGRGIVHRDLKPANILVDGSSQPKILDFGVARVTDCDMQLTSMGTDVGQLIGTLQYMSPEQVAADPLEVDARSDIYSLGVILFELLGDRLPYELRGRMIHEAARIIREEEPARLSSIHRSLAGDIETIVAKALAKERSLRYASASELAEDLRRFLRDEPILARPPSTSYQLHKFARRHRALVMGVTAVFLALTAGLIASSILYVQAEWRRREAEVQRRLAVANEQRADLEAAAARMEMTKAQSIQQFLQEMLSEADPRRTRRGDLTMREVLDTASHRLEAQFAEQPEVKAAVERTIGEAYYGLMDFERAIAHLSAAVSLLRSLGSPANADFAELLHKLGESYSYHGTGDGVPIMREALAIRERLYGDDHPLTATAKQYLGFALFRGGLAAGGNEAALVEAEALVADAKRHLESHPEAMTEQIARCRHLHGVIIGFLGRHDEAIAAVRQALAMYEELLGEHPFTWDCLDDLAMFQERAGSLEDAADSFRLLVNMGMELFGASDEKVAVRIHRLGLLHQRTGELELAERSFKEALGIWDLRQETLSAEHVETILSLCRVWSKQGREGESRERLHQLVGDLRELVDARSVEHGEDHEATWNAVWELARVLRVTGKPLDAAELFRDGWDWHQIRLGPADPKTLLWMGYYAGCLRDSGQLLDAEAIFRRRYDIRKEAGAVGDLSYSAYDLALVLRDQRRLTEAVPYARESLDIRTSMRGPSSPQALQAESLLIDILEELGATDEVLNVREGRYVTAVARSGPAVPEAFEYAVLLRRAGHHEQAAEIFHAGWQSLRLPDGTTPLASLDWMGNYAVVLIELGRAEEAEPLIREAYERYKAHDPHSLDSARAAADLSIVVHALDGPAAAIPAARESRDLYHRNLPAHQEVVVQSDLRLGEWLAAASQFEEAEETLLGVESHRESLDPNLHCAVLSGLTMLYEAWGAEESATEWRQAHQLACIPEDR